MPPFRCWTDLRPELLCCVGDRLDLKSYASARGTCTAWRRALAPPSPALLVVAESDSQWLPHAAPLLAQRPCFDLGPFLFGVRCVGSSNGWLALSVDSTWRETVFVLVNGITAVEVVLPPLIHERRWVSKVVFAPNPTKDDFVAATICDVGSIAYVTAGAKRWAVMGPIRLAEADQLTDIIYTDDGKVYCLTRGGDVHLLHLPERRRRQQHANNDDEAGPSEPDFSVLHLPPFNINDNLFLLSTRSDRRLQARADRFCAGAFRGSHMNAPATVEHLLSGVSNPCTPAALFAPPYNTVSAYTTKHLVLCEGNLYQVWRNASCTVTLSLPGGGHRRRVVENEIFVLRYHPQRQPCWDVVKDLGGYSFFVGCNNAVSMYAEGVPGLKGNCVYWIGGRGRDQGMVFDMATGLSAPCLPPHGGEILAPRRLQRVICWYLLNDNGAISNSATEVQEEETVSHTQP